MAPIAAGPAADPLFPPPGPPAPDPGPSSGRAAGLHPNRTTIFFGFGFGLGFGAAAFGSVGRTGGGRVSFAGSPDDFVVPREEPFSFSAAASDARESESESESPHAILSSHSRCSTGTCLACGVKCPSPARRDEGSPGSASGGSRASSSSESEGDDSRSPRVPRRSSIASSASASSSLSSPESSSTSPSPAKIWSSPTTEVWRLGRFVGGLNGARFCFALNPRSVNRRILPRSSAVRGLGGAFFAAVVAAAAVSVATVGTTAGPIEGTATVGGTTIAAAAVTASCLLYTSPSPRDRG